jgi:hypothetical protein
MPVERLVGLAVVQKQKMLPAEGEEFSPEGAFVLAPDAVTHPEAVLSSCAARPGCRAALAPRRDSRRQLPLLPARGANICDEPSLGRLQPEMQQQEKTQWSSHQKVREVAGSTGMFMEWN